MRFSSVFLVGEVFFSSLKRIMAIDCTYFISIRIAGVLYLMVN